MIDTRLTTLTRRTARKGSGRLVMTITIMKLLLLAVVATVIAGCATTSTGGQEQAASRVQSLVDSAPPGAAVLLVYGEAQDGWGDSEPAKVLNYPGPLSFHDRFYNIVASRSDRKIHVYYLYPGNYRLNGVAPETDTDVARVITLRADENRFLRFAAGKALDFADVGLSTVLTDTRTGGYDSARIIRHNFHEGYMGYLRGRLLGARSVRLNTGEEGCLVGQSTAEWANATMTLEAADCELSRGAIRYDDGTRVRFVLNKGTWTDHTDSSRKLTFDGDITQLLSHFDREDDFWNPAPWEDRLYLNAGPYVTIEYPDGRRVDGAPVSFEDVDAGGALPLPTPYSGGYSGQWLKADRTGFLGTINKDGPNGAGYCFDGTDGQICWRVGDTPYDLLSTVPIRTRSEIMQDVQGLSGRAAVDMLRQRMVDALLAEEWEEYLVTHRDLQTLGVDTGLESIYYEAKALSELGRVVPAFESVQAYLELAGESGAAYPKALNLYSELQPRYSDTKRRFDTFFEEAREQRRAFCEARIKADIHLCGCHEFEDLDVEEAQCDI